MKAFVSAFVSGLIAGLSSLLTALQGEHAGFSTITDGQWVTAVIAFLIGTGVGHRVYQMTPAPAAEDTPRAAPGRRTTRRPTRAASASKPASKTAQKPAQKPARKPAPSGDRKLTPAPDDGREPAAEAAEASASAGSGG